MLQDILIQFDSNSLDKMCKILSMVSSVNQNIGSQFPGEEAKAIEIFISLLGAQKDSIIAKADIVL